MNRLVAAAVTLCSTFVSASGADVDEALGRFTSARDQQETMVRVAGVPDLDAHEFR